MPKNKHMLHFATKQHCDLYLYILDETLVIILLPNAVDKWNKVKKK